MGIYLKITHLLPSSLVIMLLIESLTDSLACSEVQIVVRLLMASVIVFSISLLSSVIPWPAWGGGGDCRAGVCADVVADRDDGRVGEVQQGLGEHQQVWHHVSGRYEVVVGGRLAEGIDVTAMEN